MTDAPHFSIVVTAPRGIAHCPYLDNWQPELANHSAELIVADADEGPRELSAGPLRHARFPNASLQELMAHGVASARGEWVLITEDHCRPLPRVLAAYSRAIAKAPHADLIAGRVENLTSVAPWSWAIFAIGLGEFWRRAPRPPHSATNANFLIRRAAIRDDELTVSGGLLNGALPRLVAEGRFATCSDAIVDHVVHVDRHTVIAFEYQVTREAIAERNIFLGPSGRMAWLPLRYFLSCALFLPLRTWRNTRNTPIDRLPQHLRVAFVCVAVAARLARDDLARLMRSDTRPATSRRREQSEPAGVCGHADKFERAR